MIKEKPSQKPAKEKHVKLKANPTDNATHNLTEGKQRAWKGKEKDKTQKSATGTTHPQLM